MHRKPPVCRTQNSEFPRLYMYNIGNIWSLLRPRKQRIRQYMQFTIFWPKNPIVSTRSTWSFMTLIRRKLTIRRFPYFLQNWIIKSAQIIRFQSSGSTMKMRSMAVSATGIRLNLIMQVSITQIQSNSWCITKSWCLEEKILLKRSCRHLIPSSAKQLEDSRFRNSNHQLGRLLATQ